MMQATSGEIRQRCELIAGPMKSDSLVAAVVSVESVIGGGTAPRSRLPGYAIALRHCQLSPEDTLKFLRSLEMPIIGRIEDDRVLLDLRTVEPELDHQVSASLRLLAAGGPTDKSRA
jgi:L-seryl-tRNA(Ser) seleniumtransferase